MPKTIRAIIICPFTREVREAQVENSLEEYQRICGGGFIEFGIWVNQRDVLYVNDVAHWGECFEIGRQRVFSGCGLITGGDSANGSTERSARVSLQEIRPLIRFGKRRNAGP